MMIYKEANVYITDILQYNSLSCVSVKNYCHNVCDVTLTDNFEHKSHFIDTDNITCRDQRKNCQITGKFSYNQIL